MVRVFAGILFILTGGLLASSTAAEDTSADQLRQDVETLSSEAHEGRGLGTEGLDRAMDYLPASFPWAIYISGLVIILGAIVWYAGFPHRES